MEHPPDQSGRLGAVADATKLQFLGACKATCDCGGERIQNPDDLMSNVRKKDLHVRRFVEAPKQLSVKPPRPQAIPIPQSGLLDIARAAQRQCKTARAGAVPGASGGFGRLCSL